MMNTNMRKNTQEQKMSAYALIEISISLIVIAILGFAMLVMHKYYYKKNMDYITKTRQNYVMKALGQYAGTHSCLPYPCKAEYHNIGTQQIPTTTANQHIMHSAGYVPWKTLGIPKEYSVDAYNQPFTYVMNPLLGERIDFEPFPDSFLLEFTDLQDKYTFFYMNNNNSLDIVSDGYHDFIELTYTTHTGEIKTIDMNNSTVLDVYKLGNVIPHDKTTIYHKNGAPIIDYKYNNAENKPEEMSLYYLLHKLYNSPYLQIERIKYPMNNDGKINNQISAFFRYNPPTTKHVVRNCIAYVIIAGKNGKKILANAQMNPLAKEKIHIHLNDQTMFVTRFDITAFNGPYLRPMYLNKIQATKNLYCAQYNLTSYPYLPLPDAVMQSMKYRSARPDIISVKTHKSRYPYFSCLEGMSQHSIHLVPFISVSGHQPQRQKFIRSDEQPFHPVIQVSRTALELKHAQSHDLYETFSMDDMRRYDLHKNKSRIRYYLYHYGFFTAHNYHLRYHPITEYTSKDIYTSFKDFYTFTSKEDSGSLYDSAYPDLIQYA